MSEICDTCGNKPCTYRGCGIMVCKHFEPIQPELAKDVCVYCSGPVHQNQQEWCLGMYRTQLSVCQKELDEATTKYDAMLKMWRETSVKLAEERNQLECIDAHIETLVCPTILEEVGADKMGDRPLQLRVMRIFTFLDSATKNNLKKDEEIERLKSILIKKLVRKHTYPACGDHPEMYGYITDADGEYGAAHFTQNDALNNYLKDTNP